MRCLCLITFISPLYHISHPFVLLKTRRPHKLLLPIQDFIWRLNHFERFKRGPNDTHETGVKRNGDFPSIINNLTDRKVGFGRTENYLQQAENTKSCHKKAAQQAFKITIFTIFNIPHQNLVTKSHIWLSENLSLLGYFYLLSKRIPQYKF